MNVGEIQNRKEAPLVAALSVNPFFCKLGPDAISKIAALCTTRSLHNGENLFLRGDPGDALYGVRRGQIVISRTAGSGRQLTLNILGAGDIFGEVAILDGRPRSADAAASGPAELFVIRRNDFQELLRRQPEITFRIIELLCERLRNSSERLEEASFLPLRHRLARRLLKHSEDFGNDIAITQDNLSILVGAGRETVNRQLQKWQRSGIIRLGRGRVLILDRNGLEEEAAESDAAFD